MADHTVVAEVISLPWLAHPRALLDRTIDVGFTLTVDGRLPDPGTMRSRPLWEETKPFALISDRHPLAVADVIDPRDLAELPLHLPDKAENPDIYHLILEQLADAGVPAPRRSAPSPPSSPKSQPATDGCSAPAPSTATSHQDSSPNASQ